MAFDSVLNQCRAALEAELLHDGVLMKGNSARREIQNVGRLLHQLSLRKQLQNLTLTGSEFRGGWWDGAIEEHAQRFTLGDQGRNVGAV